MSPFGVWGTFSVTAAGVAGGFGGLVATGVAALSRAAEGGVSAETNSLAVPLRLIPVEGVACVGGKGGWLLRLAWVEADFT